MDWIREVGALVVLRLLAFKAINILFRVNFIL